MIDDPSKVYDWSGVGMVFQRKRDSVKVDCINVHTLPFDSSAHASVLTPDPIYTIQKCL